jgi:hypothetical protein
MTNASVPGAGDPGELTTKPLVTNGNTLHLNAEVHPKGTLKVEVEDANGNPIPGYTMADAVPVNGDQYDAKVQWKSGRTLAALAGPSIKLHFSLVGTDLYSYWVD